MDYLYTLTDGVMPFVISLFTFSMTFSLGIGIAKDNRIGRKAKELCNTFYFIMAVIFLLCIGVFIVSFQFHEVIEFYRRDMLIVVVSGINIVVSFYNKKCKRKKTNGIESDGSATE